MRDLIVDKGAAQVEPVMLSEPERLSLCRRPYPGHPRGCPNYGRRPSCPPLAPRLDAAALGFRRTCLVWTVFDLASHVAEMRKRHPAWSERQLANCRYWQGTARKALRQTVADWCGDSIDKTARYRVIWCPEARGVNVTDTMEGIGQLLEWPPRAVAYQVALVGVVSSVPSV